MQKLGRSQRRGEAGGPRSFGRKTLRWLGRLALVAVAIEAACYVLTLPVRRNPFSWPWIKVERDALAAAALNPGAVGQTSQLNVVPHPFFGYVFDAAKNADPGWVKHHENHPVNRFGFEDRSDFLQQRTPDRLLVGITGGSVAWWLSTQGEEDLAATLRESPRFADKDIRFLRIGAGGYKQPQQLTILTCLLALGGELDILVNLDGCNEVALSTSQDLKRGIYPFFPREWDLMVDAISDVETSRLVGRVAYLSAERQRWADVFAGPIMRHLRSPQILWKLRDKWMEGSLVEARTILQGQAREDLSFTARGPGVEGFDDATIHREIAKVWRLSSTQMHALCEANGIEYFHFLQPNQYVPGSKPMGPEELKIAVMEMNDVREGIERGYPVILEESRALLDAGVRFTDLRMVFADVEEPLYIDPFCHVNRAANQILGRRIGMEILKALGEPTFEDFSPTAWSLALDAPGKPVAIEATGRFSDGELRALSASGTAYRSSEPGVVSVSSSGELIAHRIGSAVIEVTRGGNRARIDVRAAWEPVLELEPGGGVEEPPRLVAPAGGASRGDAQFGLTVTGVPPEVAGVLFVSPRAPRELLSTPAPRGVLVVPLEERGANGSSTASVRLPVPDDPELAGKPIYCQAAFLAPGPEGPRTVAWSNLLALTVR